MFPFLPSCWWLFGYVDPNDTDSLSNFVLYTKLKTRARPVWAQPMLRRRWRNAQCSVSFNFVQKRYFSSFGCSLCGKALKPEISIWYNAVTVSICAWFLKCQFGSLLQTRKKIVFEANSIFCRVRTWFLQAIQAVKIKFEVDKKSSLFRNRFFFEFEIEK